jgi:DNA polymerase III subunit delta'
MSNRMAHDPQHPREQRHLVGHEEAERIFLESWLSGRMHHAWLIAGPSGVGKATLAYRMARFALAEGEQESQTGLFGTPRLLASLDVDLDHPAMRRALAGTHPDLLAIERPWDEKRKRYKRDLPVDEARRIAPFLHLTSAEGGWRVVIVDGADQLNSAGQNAILKIVEEPPEKTLILLVVDNVGAMLPTLRSRARKLTLGPLPSADIERLLRARKPALDGSQAMTIARMAEGSLGRALQIEAADGVALYQGMLDVFWNAPRFDALKAYQFTDVATQDDARWTVAADLIAWWLGRLAKAGARDRLPIEEAAPGEAELIQRLLRISQDSGRLDRWVEVWENSRRLFARADAASLDRRQTLMSALAQAATALGEG